MGSFLDPHWGKIAEEVTVSKPPPSENCFSESDEDQLLNSSCPSVFFHCKPWEPELLQAPSSFWNKLAESSKQLSTSVCILFYSLAMLTKLIFLNKRISECTHLNMQACNSVPSLMLHHMLAENLHMWFWLDTPLYYVSIRQLYVFSIFRYASFGKTVLKYIGFHTTITPDILQYQASWNWLYEFIVLRI